jgi:cytochrome c biogenesis protein CcdA
VVNGIVVVFVVAGIGIVEVGSFAGKETGIVAVAASSTESLSGHNTDLVLALRFRRSKDVGSAS